MNRKDYPENWGEIRKQILEIAKNENGVPQCMCTGECGLHRFTPLHTGSEPAPPTIGVDGKPGAHRRRCEELNGTPGKWMAGTVVLTTAHLCNDPKCDNHEHLKAMCQRCHLRLDVDHHKSNRRRRLEAESGQQRLLPE